MTRIEDRRVVVLLCPRCHLVHRHHEGDPVRVNGELLPRLTDANMLDLKRLHDPNYWDEAFLRSKWTNMPEPSTQHVFWRDEYESRRKLLFKEMQP